MKAAHKQWVAAALLSLLAMHAPAQDTGKSSLLDCGLRFGSASHADSHNDKGDKYQPEKYRRNFHDLRPLPLQLEAERDDFSLQVKSDSGERRLVEVITVARFECELG